MIKKNGGLTLNRWSATTGTIFPVTAVFLWLAVIPVLADAPENSLWTDVPQISESSGIGPRSEAVRLENYSVVHYVCASSGSDQNGDGSSARAYKSIKKSLTSITDAAPDKRYAVLVASGIYRGVTVNMKEYVDLYGGFRASDWSRDIFAQPTILDGEKVRRVVVGVNNCRLDGFVIQGGSAQGHGGGILCHRSSGVITNNIITANTTLIPIGFVHNSERRRHVGNDGGGIACVDAAHPIIANNIIYANSTEIGNGGGIACREDSCPKIIYNVIWGNNNGLKDIRDTRSSSGGGISCFAGVLPIINNNLIANNQSGGRSDGGGVYCEYNSSPEFYFNYVLGNRSDDDGGGMEIMKSSQPRIHFNTFAGNYGGGGAIRVSDQGLAQITNNLIARNGAPGKGGGVACSNAWMILNNNTIIENKAMVIGGVEYLNDNWPQLRGPVVSDNIIWGNTDMQIGGVIPAGHITSNVIQGGYPGTGNTDRDPVFIDDGLKATVSSVSFDLSRFVTTLTISASEYDSSALAGRVVLVGKKWSLIKNNTANQIVVWGQFDASVDDLEILPTYRLGPDSPCPDKGIQYK